MQEKNERYKKEYHAKYKQDENRKTVQKSRCPYAKKCGGCQFIDMPYEKQLERKQKELKALLGKFARVSPIIGMEDPLHYRHKVHAVMGYEKGEPIAGVYQEKSHRLVRVDQCLIENEKADAIIQSIRGLLKSFKIKTYDEDSDRGLLRHIMVRVSHATGEIMVILVLRSPILPSKNNFAKALLKLHPEITTIVLNVNDKKTTMVLGQRDIVLYGPGFIYDSLCGVRFRLSPQSFYQVNPLQTEILYREALKLAKLTKKDKVIDAYCGIGTIGLIASRQAGSVLGIELNREAVKDARENAKHNQCKNIEFACADAGEYMVEMAQDGEKADVVIMDPPRSGSNEVFLSSVCRLSPNRIVYISCGPQSLARDLDYLTAHGYRTERIQPVDLFPMTVHVETVVLLSKGAKGPVDLCSARTEVERRMVDSRKVKVDFSLEDMDLYGFRGKATYEQIKTYVLEQTGLKVSSLYIAQIKKKCGLDVGENFNPAKSENARQPQCTPEKEDAIMQAFSHFGII